jgi:tripartite-type tricarboxylate transporter receptor subunit TctC
MTMKAQAPIGRRVPSLLKAIGLTCLTAVFAIPARADTVATFYAGKTINIQVGYTVGGGYDLYARAMAPYLAKHMPGSPQVLVKNMPGAGSYKLAAWMQSVAPRDGTEIATITRGAPVEEMLGGLKTNFDPLKANWIGSMNNEVSICIVNAKTGVTSLADMKNKEISFGTQGKGSDSEMFAVFLRSLFGLKIKVINGYPGTNESILAMERGEVDGNCGWSWTTAKQNRPQWFKDGTVNIIMQMALSKHADLANVPLITEMARNDAERAQIELVMSRQTMGRPFFVPPDVPADRVAALRRAFMAAMKDPGFLANAERMKLETNAVSGEEVQAMVTKLLNSPADIVAMTRRNVEAAN